MLSRLPQSVLRYADRPSGTSRHRFGAPRLRVQRSTDGTLIELSGDEPSPAQRQLRGWLLDASAVEQPLARLRLDWSSEQEGFQHFRIEASDDLRTWRPWGQGQLARLSFADERI